LVDINLILSTVIGMFLLPLHVGSRDNGVISWHMTFSVSGLQEGLCQTVRASDLKSVSALLPFNGHFFGVALLGRQDLFFLQAQG
jgi:hypothetical protein